MKKSKYNCPIDYQTLGKFWQKIFNKAFRRANKEYIENYEFSDEKEPELKESKSDKVWKHR